MAARPGQRQADNGSTQLTKVNELILPEQQTQGDAGQSARTSDSLQSLFHVPSKTSLPPTNPQQPAGCP